MQLARYVDEVRQQLLVAAETGGDEVRAAADLLASAAAPAVHLALLDALGDAAAELTAELAPGSVELRLRGREPSWVVTLPPAEHEAEDPPATPVDDRPAPAGDVEDAELARINLRLPKALKDRVDLAAASEGLSTNAWLVRVAAAAVDPAATSRPRRAATGGDHFTGWAQ
jgi:HicB family